MRRRRTTQQQGSGSKPLRVVLLGKDGVGKSALTVRFMTRRFIGEYDRTLESTYRHMMQIENEDIIVDIMDTAGENTDVKIRRTTRRGDLFIILYSIVDRSSFDEAQSIARYIRDHRNIESMSIVIVATKKDLDHFRRVDIEEGIAFSNEQECTFYEVSISEGYNEVQDLLKELLKRVLTHKNIDKRDTLKIPSLGIRRTPSLEKKKIAPSLERSTLKTQYEIQVKDLVDAKCSPESRRRKDYVDGQLKPAKSLRDLSEEIGSKIKLPKRSSPITQRKKNPFGVDKVKGAASANKLPKIEDENKTGNQKVFTLQRRGHSSRGDLGYGHESSDRNNNENKKPIGERQSADKPKGPFLLNKLHNGSTDKLRASASNDRPTTSFGRMRVGFERTFGRKKAVYL